MSTSPEECGEVPPVKEAPDPFSTPGEASELPQVINISDTSRNVNSPETSPSTGRFESKATSDGQREDQKIKSSAEEYVKVFSTNDNAASNLQSTGSYENIEASLLSKSTVRRNKDPSVTRELKQLAVPSDDTGFTNNAFELEVSQKKADTQVSLIMEILDQRFYSLPSL
jgi:hypothetical protein